MSVEKQPLKFKKEWTSYIHENGGTIMDLEVFDQADMSEPVVALFGLSPRAIAYGIMAQKDRPKIRLDEYIKVMSEILDPPIGDEMPFYH